MLTKLFLAYFLFLALALPHKQHSDIFHYAYDSKLDCWSIGSKVKSQTMQWRQVCGADWWLYIFWTSALYGGEWSTLQLYQFTPGKLPGTY